MFTKRNAINGDFKFVVDTEGLHRFCVSSSYRVRGFESFFRSCTLFLNLTAAEVVRTLGWTSAVVPAIIGVSL